MRPRRPAGSGCARQLKNEIFHCPPVLVLTGRPAGRLAGRRGPSPTRSSPHPLDPVGAGRRGRPACPRAPPRSADRDDRAASRPRPTWPDLLSSLLAPRRTSTPAQARWAMDPDHVGATPRPVQVAGFLVGPARQGRERRRAARPRRRHARARAPDRGRRPQPRHRRHRRRPAAHRQHLDHVRRWSSPPPGCASSSTATGRPRRPRGRRTSSRRWASTSPSPPDQVAEVAERAGITFCFAQIFHPSMRHAAAARSELGSPTAFNVLGPMTNPAQPDVCRRRRRRRRGWHRSWRGSSPTAAARRSGVPRRRRSRRGHHRDDDAPCGGSAAARSPSRHARPRGRSACPVARSRTLRGGDAAYNAAGGDPAARRGDPAVRDAVLLNAGHRPGGRRRRRGRPSVDGHRRRGARAGWSSPPEAIDSGAARSCSALGGATRWIAAARAGHRGSRAEVSPRAEAEGGLEVVRE